MADTSAIRGAAVSRELRSIDRASKLLFKDHTSDHGGEFRKVLEERRGVFVLRLHSMLGIFKLSRQLLCDWREAVFRGEEMYEEPDDSQFKALFTTWIPVAERFRQRAEFYARHHLPIDSSVLEDLKMYIEESSRILQAWSKPGLSMAFSLRTRKLSRAGEKKLLMLK